VKGGLCFLRACTFDTTQCQTADHQLDDATFGTAFASSAFATESTIVIDDVGDIDADPTSEHRVRVFSARSNRDNAWNFVFATNGDDYEGFTETCGDGSIDDTIGEECDQEGDETSCEDRAVGGAAAGRERRRSGDL
jgi:hypothetical protein